MKGSPQEEAYLALLDNAPARGVLHDYFDARFREAARAAASPERPAEERAQWCSQMAVWLSLADQTKGK